jgi:hypothetical protein
MDMKTRRAHSPAAWILALAFSTQAFASISPSDYSGYPGKRTGSAYAWALGGTALPIIAGMYLIQTRAAAPGGLLMASGILVGPSLGQFYAGSLGPGLGATLLRTTGGILMIAGLAEAFDDWDCDEGRTCDGNNGATLGLLGLGAFFGGTLYSFIDTHFAVKRANASVLQMSPEIRLSKQGAPALGMRASLNF